MDKNVFEEIKKINKYKSEFWSSRDLFKVLQYASYDKFLKVIDKAKKACENSGEVIHNHFSHLDEMVKIGSGAERSISVIHLSRYACYLIIQNSDPSKEIVALGQTYFAIQTRRQEKTDQLVEDNKRVMLRDEIKKHNASLAEAADNVGVKNYGKFQNFGYMGLYGNLKVLDIHKKKKLKKSQRILDHMGSEELAANLFRATQTDAKLRREDIKGEEGANMTHYSVGKKVRKTIEELGGTMPEKLPSTDGVGKARKRIKKKDKRNIELTKKKIVKK